MDLSNFVEDAAVINKDTFISIEEDLDSDEEKAEAYKLVILSYLTDNIALSQNKHINTIVRMCRAGQIGTMQRHKKSKEDGSKGGKAVKIDHDEVFRLRDKGYTQIQIGKSLGCSDRQVRNILSEDKSGNEKAEMKAEVPEEEISGNEEEISHAEMDAEEEVSGNNLKTKTKLKTKIKKETKLPITKKELQCSDSFSDSSFSSSDSSSFTKADVVELLTEICGYDNQKHISNTVNKQLFCIGYSCENVYKALREYEDEISKAIEAPNVNCYGQDRAIAIAIGIVKKKKPSTFEVMKKLDAEKRSEINQAVCNQDCFDIKQEYENSDIPF